MPFALATTADPSLITKAESAREDRIQGYVESYRNEFGAETEEEAIARYKEAYERNTAVIDEEGSKIEMPGFVDRPPLGLDDELDYKVLELPGKVAVVASTFENITSGTVGLAFDMTVVPQSHLVYLAALPTVIREIGMIKDGEPAPYDEVEELIRREILSLRTYYSTSYRTERVEFTLRGAGSDLKETERALEWMQTALFHPDLRPENLPRIRDAIDLELKSARNRMRGSEESWVNTPVYSFWKQHNPVLLNADCFLTQVHALHRLRWLLKEELDASLGFQSYVEKLSGAAEGSDRESMSSLLTAIVEGEDNDFVDLSKLDEKTADLFKDATRDLQQSLSEIPDESLADDFRYLGNQMAQDLEVAPESVLEEIAGLLGMIRHQDNVRAFMISNSSDRAALTPTLEKIILELDSTPSARQSFKKTDLVASRVRGRGESMKAPTFVALVNENTRSGVHLHTTDCANYEDRDKQILLRFLAARLYGGGGAHSMFMKTWGAGLAYSNGLRSNESNGRLIYYAERCPDLAQTLQFVVGELEDAPHDPSLADYAVAQAFSGNRSGARYEQRGEAMAANLADGLDPEVVAGFRQGILDLREDPGLYDKLHNLMEDTYGEVLPGYGPSGARASRNSNAIYFVIGPEKQLSSWEDYLRSVEPDARLTRIYPRDYWQTPPVSN
jgi:Zn-dependent M16 (insulinase) family peptidase